MRLSIITINYNNSCGLEKTIQSVWNQTRKDFEYVVIDGASNDNSLKVVLRFSELFANRFKWVSEPDCGIYDAMNKGIGMASGDYVQFLNSGDCLVSDDVVEKMLTALEDKQYPSILYGNMLKDMPDGGIVRDKCFAGQEITLLGFYAGTLNHSPAFIRRSLFEKYGLYDEKLKIASDWKWYLKAVILGDEKPVYTDIDVTLFDMTGISETNKELDKAERAKVLTEFFPSTILADYEQWSFSIGQIKRLKRYPLAYKVVWLLERSLFKVEKWKQKRNRI